MEAPIKTRICEERRFGYKQKKSDLVCIHDGARPFVSEKLIKNSINACKGNDGAIVAIPNYDTIKTCVKGYVETTIGPK